MNRVTRLLHKANFLARQRRALHYGQKFVITDQDLGQAETKSKVEPAAAAELSAKELFDKVVEGFDPINDEQDRRILYEVTGMRLNQAEFRGESSSDSFQGEGGDGGDLLEIDYAYRFKGSDSEGEDEDEAGEGDQGTPLFVNT